MSDDREEMRVEVSYEFLRPGDRARLHELLKYCFILTDHEVRDWVNDDLPGEWLLAGYEGDDLVGGAIVQPRQLVGMRDETVATIGGVATAPCARGRGVARGLMGFALQCLREQRIAWTVLYPFEFDFYAKLGWGQGAPMIRLAVRAPRLLGRVVGRGRYCAVGTESWERLDEIHRAWASGGPGALRRDRRDWRRVLERPLRPRACVLWESDAGAAYLVYELRRTPGAPREEGACTVHDWAWTSAAARDALLAFLARHQGQVGTVVLKVAIDDPLANLEGIGVERSFLRGPMVRLVDVASATGCEATRPCASLRVRDPLCPWNDGSTLQGEGGQPPEETPPTPETDVATLSCLLWGSMSPGTACQLGLIRRANAQLRAWLLARVPRDPPFFLDWF